MSTNGPPVCVTQLGYLGIGVSNMSEWKEFSTDILGLQLNGGTDDGAVFVRMDDNHHRFELLPTGEDDIVFHGWEVKDQAALAQMTKQIEGSGIEVRQASQEENARRMVLGHIKFLDPDGIPTEVYFGPYLDHRPFVSKRGIRSFKAGALGLGHEVLAVADPQAYLKFYTEVMGAKVSDFILVNRGGADVTLTFLHVNPRHHSLAVVGRRKAEGGAKQPKRLGHFMLEVDELDEVGLASGLFQQKNIPMGNLGRHTNDKMLSFYGLTPSGFLVEYGYGGSLIDDEDTWKVLQYRATSIWGHGNRPQV